MRVLSLFSGGGLGDYGLTLAGMEIVGQVEIDEYCQKILNLRWPEVPKWRDIRDVKGKEVLERCGTIDLISGGFPCQDISTAGKGAGIEGERSGLWKEYFRIICEIRPKYVFVENVAALLDRGMGVVLGDLASIGYDTEWDCIKASTVGALHNRKRIWIIAYPNSQGLERLGRSKENSGKIGCGEWKPKDIAESNRKKIWSDPITSILRVDDGAPKRMERIKLCGNGQVVQVVEWIGKQILEFDKQS